MYQGRRIIAIVPAYNEEQKISQVVARTPREIVDRLLVVDDGSTDRTAAAARAGGAEVLSHGKVLGVMGSSGRQLKQFGWIHEMNCTSENELLVGELLNCRVQKLTIHPQGK